MSLSFIYFDLGNVLLNFDNHRACRQMADVAGVAPEVVQAVVFDGALQQRYERGEITSRQFYDEFRQATKSSPDYEALLQAGSAIFEMNIGVIPIVAHLSAAGYRLGILSNTCPAHWAYISDGRYTIIRDYFDQFVLSYEVGAMKPSTTIYAAATAQAGVAPADTFFVDDRIEHVAAARQFGWLAEQFTTPAKLAADLRRHGARFNY